MKVLLIHNRYRHEGGEERVIDHLENLLKKHGHEVRRFERSSQDWQNHSPWQLLCDALQVPYSRTIARELNHVIDQWLPDVAHVHNVFPVLSPAVYVVLRRRGIPVAQTVHNYRFMCVNGLFLTPKGKICERCKGGFFAAAIALGCYGGQRLRTIPMAIALTWPRLFKTLEKTVDVFIAPSQFLKQKLVEVGFPSDRIEVIPNPSVSVNQSAARSAAPRFVYAGRLSREKGLWTLLRAFDAPDLGQLRILGDGPLRESLQNDISSRHLTHIKLAGAVPHAQVLQELSQAWALIMPSECYENQPQAILEAWACGTPVIGSRLGGMLEMIQEGKTGWTFKSGDIQGLRDAIRQRIRHDVSEAQISSDCQFAVRSYYNPDSITDRIVSIYERIIDHRRTQSA